MAKKSKKTNFKDNNPAGAHAVDNIKKSKKEAQKKTSKNTPLHSNAFLKLQAAYDAGNYSLLQKRGKDTSELSADEQAEAARLIKLSKTDPTALAIGIAVVTLVLIVSFTLLTPA